MSALFDSSAIPSDKIYSQIRDLPPYELYRSHVEEMWSQFEPYADRGFDKKIQLSFHQHYWEMYLGNALLQHGHKIAASLKNHGPDLYLLENNQKIWVEAIAVNRGTTEDAPPDLSNSLVEFMPGIKHSGAIAKAFNEDPILLRYSSAIHNKYEGRTKYVTDKIVSESDPYVIALNGAETPLCSTKEEPPRIIKALLGIGDMQYTFDAATMEFIGSAFEERRTVCKKMGVPVHMDIFTDASHEGLSAVLFSCVNVVNHPNHIG